MTALSAWLWWAGLGCAPEALPPAGTPAADTEPEPEVPRGALSFRFPLVERELFIQVTGVDHDPEVHEWGPESLLCTNYLGEGFPGCYDEHDGSDFLLDGGFDQMDNGSATIVAAYDGVVVDTEDGHYDRCHGTLDGVDCDGYPKEANYVIVEHEGGFRTRYWHMKTDSVAVAVGDDVVCGDALGIVGSSGNSSMPHLHFEVEDADGIVFDPYAGPWSQAETWWVEQGDPDSMPGSDCADDLQAPTGS